MRRLVFAILVFLAACLASSAFATESGIIKSITVRAPRDMGYFAGDLVRADIEILIDGNYALQEPSLPHAGPVNYWLDLRRVDITSHRQGAARRYTLKIFYQNFYDALDARPQEIPTFPVSFSNGTDTVSADVPAWTIGVSALREVAPPVKEDPKDYMRADEYARFVDVGPLWWSAAAAALATLLALGLLARDRAWPPFQARPARVFADASRRLRALADRPDADEAYLEALLMLHRGIDATDGGRVLADDVPTFLGRHAMFEPLRDQFLRFFAASRSAFFGSDPNRARRELGLGGLQGFARQLAAIERAAP